MLEKLVGTLTDGMIAAGSINSEDRSLYQFGLETGLSMIGTFLTTVLIGLIMEQTFGSVVSLFAFVPLRSFAGGYHASTRMKCYILSCAVTIGTLYLAGHTDLSTYSGTLLLVPLAFCSVILILLLAPIENPNKPLDPLEKLVYAKRARVILLLEVLIYVGLLVVRQGYFATIFALTFVIMAFTLFFGADFN